MIPVPLYDEDRIDGYLGVSQQKLREGIGKYLDNETMG
jgi:hypothetical protein